MRAVLSGLFITAIVGLQLPPAAAGGLLEDAGKAIVKGTKETGRAIKKGATEAGKAIEQGAEETGKLIEQGAKKAGKAIEEGARETQSGLVRFGRDVDQAFCELFSGDRADAGCRNNEAVGYDRERGPYAYDPRQPDGRYYGTETGEARTPQERDLREYARFLSDSQVKTWEHEDNDRYGVQRFLSADTPLGEAWPNAALEVKPPTRSGKVLACCGGGGFLNPRLDQGEVRFHAGTDYATQAGEEIYAPVTGSIIGYKNPGRDGLTGLLIANDRGYTATVYFVDPKPDIADALSKSERVPVTAGVSPLGTSQKLQPAYPPDVPQHVHVVLADPKGNAVAPDGSMKIRRTPKSTDEVETTTKSP